MSSFQANEDFRLTFIPQYTVKDDMGLYFSTRLGCKSQKLMEKQLYNNNLLRFLAKFTVKHVSMR